MYHQVWTQWSYFKLFQFSAKNNVLLSLYILLKSTVF